MPLAAADFSPHGLQDLEKRCGAKFTIAAHCSDQTAAGYFEKCCHAEHFLHQDVSGHHVWLNMPVKRASAYIKHYLSCKAKAPLSTSACILVPASFKRASSRNRRLLKGMQLLMQITERDDCVSALQPGHWHIYADAKVPQMRMATSQPNELLMCVAGRVAGSSARVLFDSGATHVFMSNSFATKSGLRIRAPSRSAEVQVADGKTLSILGTCFGKLQLGSYSAGVSFHVTDISQDWDVIVGQSWLLQHCVVMDYGNCCLKGWKNGRQFNLQCLDSSRSSESVDPSEAMPKLLSIAQCRRSVRHGCKCFLVNVTSVSETPDINPAVQAVLDEYSDRFPEDLQDLPPVRPVFHTIPLQDPASQPPFKPLYRLSPTELAEVDKQVKSLLAKGYIEPSSSPYGAPILFVEKKDKTLRMVIDYRALNKLTVKNRYPLPRIDDLLDGAQGACVFSSLDLMSGYHQIRIRDEDVPKTAFRTPFGLFQWRVLSFGLTNAPATFQAVMNDVFRPVLHKFVLVYLDDILIFSRSLEEHLDHLRQVLDILRTHSFYAKLSKCSFAQPEVDFLGHVLGKDGLRVDPRKTAAVQSWPVPTDVHQVRSFLGLANYFRKFIPNYASLTYPLNGLLRKEVPYSWSAACATAFQAVKDALTSAPVLALPDFTHPFELDIISDASGFGLGAILLQNGRPVAYESRQLNAAERNYGTGEQELLAVVHALKVWRCYLEGAAQVTVITDHEPNTFFSSKPTLSRRQARWEEFLSRFHFTWQYKPGAKNPADPLSRRADLLTVKHVAGTYQRGLRLLAMTRGAYSRSVALTPQPQVVSGRLPELVQQVAPSDLEIAVPDAGTTSADYAVGAGSADAAPPSATGSSLVADWRTRLISAYAHDPWFADAANVSGLELHQGLWYDDSGRIVVPDYDDLRKQIVTDFHASPYAGHMGIHKTRKLVARYYWWPGMGSQIESYVNTCHSCQKNKARTTQPAGLLQPLELPLKPWEHVTMDFITQLPLTLRGHDAIFVVVDKLTKMVHIMPTTTSCSARVVAEMYRDHVFVHHGIPAKIISDRDTRFTGAFNAELTKMLGIQQAMSTAYHPQTDGQTERVNRVLEDMLRHFVAPSQDDWDEHLACAEFAINNATHVSTGYSPFELNYGRSPRLPLSLEKESNVPAVNEFIRTNQRRITEARASHRIATQRQKQFADLGRRDVQFNPDDWVLLSSKNLHFKVGTPKLLPRWVGPFQVVRAVGKQAYELNLPARWRIHDTFHVSQLEPYRTDGSVQPPPPAELLDGEVEYEVQSIRDHRAVKSGKRTSFEYLVAWRGCGPESDSWEPESNLRNAPQSMQVYWDSVGPRSKARALHVAHDSAMQPAPADGQPGEVTARSILRNQNSRSRKRRLRRSKLASAGVTHT